MLLDCQKVSVAFGGVRAVTNVDLSLERGQILGLIGPNGAGKTTFIDAISGFVPAGGTVTLQGFRLDTLPAHKRARAGLARTWQSGELFDDLTVIDNIRMAAELVSPKRFVRDLLSFRRVAPSDRVTEVVEQLGISEFAARMVKELSPGQAQLVGLARAVASDPHVVLMDEPAAGLDNDETKLLAGEIRALAERGVGVVLVDHDMDLVFSVCDRVQVMRTGETLAEGTVSEIRRNPAVRKAYLGTSDDEDLAAALPLPGAGVAL